MRPEAEAAPRRGWNARHQPWTWLGAYLALRLLLGVLHLPDATPPVVVAAANGGVALAMIGLPIGGLAAVARRTPRLPLLLGAALAALLVWWALAASTAGPASGAVQDLAKVVAAGGVGMALARALREANLLVPAGLFAAMADFVVVKLGTVKVALSTERGQALVQAVSAQVPAVHASLTPLTIGPADFLFLGLFLGCAARFGMPLRRTAAALAAVLTISLVLVPVVGAIPALAPMALAFLAVNRSAFRLTREEVVGSAVVVLAAAALFLAYFQWLAPAR